MSHGRIPQMIAVWVGLAVTAGMALLGIGWTTGFSLP
jgi:hypothetical protein